MKYLGGVAAKDDVRREVRWYQRHQTQHGHTFWVMERKRDKAFLGFCGIIRLGEQERPLAGELEIGWRVRDDMWRRGYGYEAAHAVVDWCELELHGTLYARVHRANAASQELARKLGMRRARAIEARQSRRDSELFIFRSRLNGQACVHRQNIWRNSRRRLAECRPRLGN